MYGTLIDPGGFCSLLFIENGTLIPKSGVEESTSVPSKPLLSLTVTPWLLLPGTGASRACLELRTYSSRSLSWLSGHRESGWG